MFRAELIQSSDGSILKVEGRLVGDWANEVRALITRGPLSRQLFVDLTEVSYVDPVGEQVLTWLSSLGARFVAKGVYAVATCKRLKLALHSKPFSPETSFSRRAGNARRYGLMKEGMSMLLQRKFGNRNVSFGRPLSLALLTGVLAMLSLATSGCKLGHAAIPQIITEVQVAEPIQRDVPVHNEWVASLDGYVNADIRPQVSGLHHQAELQRRFGRPQRSGPVRDRPEAVPGDSRPRQRTNSPRPKRSFGKSAHRRRTRHAAGRTKGDSEERNWTRRSRPSSRPRPQSHRAKAAVERANSISAGPKSLRWSMASPELPTSRWATW